MKRVVSISLGSSKRDKSCLVNILGQSFEISRIGTDGNQQKFSQLFKDLDGKVDALGVGGADIYVVIGKKRYTFREIYKLVQGAKKTPVVDGSGLKHTLEREAIKSLQANKIIDFHQERVLLVSGVDRFGMAQALAELCPYIIFGDLLFGLGINFPLRNYKIFKFICSAIAPIIVQLPLRWFYPTGNKQENRTPKFQKIFDECTVIAGDWHFIRRYAPTQMQGKTIITQTLRKDDIKLLQKAGVKRVITTTPIIEEETFATNVMEACLIAYLNKPIEQLTETDYLETLKLLHWQPNIIELGSGGL